MAPQLPLGFRLIEYNTVGSTNDEAKRYAEAGAADGLIVRALEQTAGRGRLGRTWQSPHGNLYASFIIRPNVPLRRASEIVFAAALAVYEAVDRYAFVNDIRCKWPNDVIAGGRKIAGILAEAAGGQKGDTSYIVVGFGINVESYPTDSRLPATSFRELGDGDFARIGFEELAGDFGRWRHRWESEGFEPIREAWIARSYDIGKLMHVNTGKARLIGRFAGLHENGALLLDVADGRRETITYGEVESVDVR